MLPKKKCVRSINGIAFSGLPEDNNITNFLITCRELAQQNFDAGPDRIEEFLSKFQGRLGSLSSDPKPTRRRNGKFYML